MSVRGFDVARRVGKLFGSGNYLEAVHCDWKVRVTLKLGKVGPLRMRLASGFNRSIDLNHGKLISLFLNDTIILETNFNVLNLDLWASSQKCTFSLKYS